MVKYIVGLLLLVILGLAAVMLVRDDPGFVLLRYRDYSIETSLAFALVALIVAVVVLFYSLRLLRALLRLPGAMQRQSQNRRRRNPRCRTNSSSSRSSRRNRSRSSKNTGTRSGARSAAKLPPMVSFRACSRRQAWTTASSN